MRSHTQTPKTELVAKAPRSALLAVIAGAMLVSACAHDASNEWWTHKKQYVPSHLKVAKHMPGTSYTLGGRGPGGEASAPAARENSEKERLKRRELFKLLAGFRNAGSARQREALLRKAEGRLPRFKETLINLVYDSSAPYLEEAIDLVVELRITDATSALTELANGDDGKLAASAIRGVERFYPWTDADLRRFLLDKRIPVVLVALELLRTRTNRQLDLIVPMLAHTSARVRTLAMQAIPRLNNGTAIDRLCRFARTAERVTKKRAIEAIGRTGVPSRAEAFLIGFLRRPDMDLRVSALLALANKSTPLTDPDPVLKLALDQRQPLRFRAQALAVLENTGTAPVDELRWNMQTLPPILRVLAARCLVRAGERKALQDLVWLLDTELSNDDQIEHRILVTRWALEALCEVSGRNLPASPRAWRVWLRKSGDDQLLPLRSHVKLPWDASQLLEPRRYRAKDVSSPGR